MRVSFPYRFAMIFFISFGPSALNNLEEVIWIFLIELYFLETPKILSTSSAGSSFLDADSGNPPRLVWIPVFAGVINQRSER
jgi:hypothetical protein